MYEFQTFAKSPFSMTVYDTKARYEQQTHSVSDSETDESDGNDSDLIIVSPSASTGTVGAHTVVPSHSHHTRHFEPPAERRWFEIDVTPRTDNLRDLLEATSLPGQSGWESPTPGPSGGSFLLGALETQTESTRTHRKRKKVTDTKVKVEEETGNRQIINSGSDTDSGASSDVIFVGFDRPWQERSPLLISSAEEAAKDDKKPKCETDKHPKTKTSEQTKSTVTRPRNESYSSDERYSSVSSSYSRHRLLHKGHHRKGRYRSPSYTRSKEDRPSSYSRYHHKKFSQKRQRHRSSKSSSADDFDDYRHSRRSVSTTSKSSRHSTKHDQSNHERYVLEKSSSRSHSRSPYCRKKDDHKTHRHRSHSNKCKSRELMAESREHHSKHKKHKKHKHKRRHEKQRSHRQKERRSKECEKRDPFRPRLALSDSSKDEQWQNETCKTKCSGEQVRSKIVIPNREIEYSDVSDDSMSFSAQTRFKKHPSGHKKSRANDENNYHAATSTRNITSLRSPHETAESDQSDATGQKSPKSSSVNESTKESDLDLRDMVAPLHEVIENVMLQNQPGGSAQKEPDSAGAASVSSVDSGVASLKVLAFRKSTKDLILPNCGEGSKNSSDDKETDSVNVTEMSVSTTDIDDDCSSADEMPTVKSTTYLHLNKKNNEFSDSTRLDTFGLTSDCFTDARLSLDELFQTSNVETVELETVTIESSSDDDSIYVSSSSVYVDTARFPEQQPSRSLSLNVLDSISSILCERDNGSVLPGSTSDKPCNIESDDQIEINSDSDEEIIVDFSTENSTSAMDVESKSRRNPQCEMVDSESETDLSCHSTQRGPISNSSNFISESCKDSENGQTGQVNSSNILTEIEDIVVNPSAPRSTDESDSSSENRPLDLSAQSEGTHLQNHTDNTGSTDNESDSDRPNTLIDEVTSEESSSDGYTAHQALDLRARAENSRPVTDCSESNSVPNAECCEHDMDSSSTIVTAGSCATVVNNDPPEHAENDNSEHGNEPSLVLSVVNNCSNESSEVLVKDDAISSLEKDIAKSSVNTNINSENSCEGNEKNTCGVSKNTDLFFCNDQISNEISDFGKKATGHEYNYCDSSDIHGLNLVHDILSENYHHSLLPEWCQDSLPSSCVERAPTAELAGPCSVVDESPVKNGCSSELPVNVAVSNNPNAEMSSACSLTASRSSESPSAISVADGISGDSVSMFSGVNSLSEWVSPSTLVAKNLNDSPLAVSIANGISESPSTISVEKSLSESFSTNSVVNSITSTSSTSLLNNAIASSSSDKHSVINCSLISNTSAHIDFADYSKGSDKFQDQNSQLVPDSQQKSASEWWLLGLIVWKFCNKTTSKRNPVIMLNITDFQNNQLSMWIKLW